MLLFTKLVGAAIGFHAKLAVRTIEKNRDVILGIKIRLDRDITRDHDIAALRLAREASDAVKLPLMVHIGDTYSPLKDILPMLNKGDVVTHCFRGEPGGILDAKGRVIPAVRSAVERGVHLDVGHGQGSFSFPRLIRRCNRASCRALFRVTSTRLTSTVQFSIWRPRFPNSCTLG